MTVFIQKIGTGSPIVLFHGWGFDHQIWMPWVTRLQHEPYQFYLVDLPGFGKSAYLEWDEFKKNLLAQLPDQFTLMGWSMGGMMATRLAIESPERVSQLINVASSPRFTATTDWPAVEVQKLDEFYQRLINNPAQTQQQFMLLQLQKQTIPLNLSQVQASEQGLKQGLELLKHWDLRTHIMNLCMPVSYIMGRLDALIPYQLMQTMQQQYPNFQYMMIKKAAHIPFLSHPETFTDYLNELFNNKSFLRVTS